MAILSISELSSPNGSQEASGCSFLVFLGPARQLALKDASRGSFKVCLGPARQITLRMLLDAHSEEQS